MFSRLFLVLLAGVTLTLVGCNKDEASVVDPTSPDSAQQTTGDSDPSGADATNPYNYTPAEEEVSQYF